MIPLSVVILTKNEEQDLPGCLASIKWCDDIHIIDSGSTDRTVAIAKQADVKCQFNRFESFGSQRNWALERCEFQHDWILFLDADEQATEEFCDALCAAITNADDEVAGFYCCWKMMLYDRWLRYSDSFPKWQFRLLRRGRARFTDYGHGQKEEGVIGRIEYIQEPYLHFAFSKGWSHWIDRHNKYSQAEAIERLQQSINWKNILSVHGSVRNKALKPVVSKLPGWPLLRFFVTYFLKLGFLEGWPAFVYCVNLAYYEFLIQIKMDELQKQQAKV